MTCDLLKSPRLTHLSAMLMVIGAIALTGCGSSTAGGNNGGANNGGGAAASSSQATTSAPHIYFAKTKFIFHAGLAFGAFHRYIYKPFRRGGFSPPSRHKAAIVKAGLAALFAYHEAKIALMDAQASSLLSPLVAPLTALQSQLSGLSGRLKSGVLDATGINAAASTVDRIGSQSASSYKAIPDAPTPSLGR